MKHLTNHILPLTFTLTLNQAPHNHVNISSEKQLGIALLMKMRRDNATYEYRCKQVGDVPGAGIFGDLLSKNRFKNKFFHHLLNRLNFNRSNGWQARKKELFFFRFYRKGLRRSLQI